MTARAPCFGRRDANQYRPSGTLGVVFQSSVGTLALGHASRSRPRPSTWNRRLFARVRWWGARTALLRPVDDLIAVVDDAAAMAPEGRAVVLPAQVVECAPLDAQEFGSFVDRKKGIVGGIGHEELPNGR